VSGKRHELLDVHECHHGDGCTTGEAPATRSGDTEAKGRWDSGEVGVVSRDAQDERVGGEEVPSPGGVTDAKDSGDREGREALPGRGLHTSNAERLERRRCPLELEGV